MKNRLNRLFSKEKQNTTVSVDTTVKTETIESAKIFFQQGNQSLMAGDFQQAVEHYRQAVKLKPDFADAYCNMGVALKEIEEFDAAIDGYQHALSITPEDAEIHNNLGEVFYIQRNLNAAVASFRQAIKLNANLPLVHQNLALTFKAQDNLAAAIVHYELAAKLSPDNREWHKQLGILFQILNRQDKAIEHYQQAIALSPELVDDVYSNLGVIFQEQRNFDKAIVYMQKAFAAFPNYIELFDRLFYTQLCCCDWTNYATYAAKVREDINHSIQGYTPFHIIAISDSAKVQQRCAAMFANRHHPAVKTPLWTGELYQHDKIRLAYISADFHQHATAYLMAELFELHDKSRFELIAISFGVNDHSEMRHRLEQAFDQFIDVSAKSDAEIASLIKNLEIDIALDLKGYTTDYRAGIFAYRPAPVQVNYLGYPGTMASSYIDYIIADRVVIPPEHQAYYTEKVVYLPESYQVNDSKRVISNYTPSRAEVGLPESGFVFCCFNNNFKITPQVFDCWMRLLHKVEGSVLWLLATNPVTAVNLKNEAKQRGIAEDRLIFASRIKLDEHLARQCLADLFLDTLIYNAHTTTSDALWAGLPVVTCMGNSFASRVAGSLLNAIGLPELISYSLEEYEALALKLATHLEQLTAIKAKLVQNRLSYPLFNTQRFTRHIESAYITMWERSQRAEPPISFSVPTIESYQNEK